MRRKKYPSIIEARRDSIPDTQARRDWARVSGKREYPKRTFYVNVETKDEFYYIAGAIGWPMVEGNIPGYTLIVGVKKTDDGRCSMVILDELEDVDIPRLVIKCIMLREKYGYWQSSSLLRHFYGDDKRYRPIEYNTTRQLKEMDGDGPEHGFHIYQPYDFEETNHFEIYVQQLGTALRTKEETGEKDLLIGNNAIIRNAISNLQKHSVSNLDVRKRAKQFPAVFALGCLVHTLLQTRPWLEGSGGEAFNMDF